MKMELTKQDVWVAPLKDKPGALAEKLNVLAEGGVDLEFVIARRGHEKAGAVAFVTGLKGVKDAAAARKAGFSKSKHIHGLKIETANTKGVGAAITTALGDAKINLRGLSGAGIGRKAIINIAFDKAADRTKALRILRKL
jgi:hypothetical protein